MENTYGMTSLLVTVVFLLTGLKIKQVLTVIFQIVIIGETCLKIGECTLLIETSVVLPKIEEIRSLSELPNASVIGNSETKLVGSLFTSEIVIEGFDRPRKIGGAVYFIKHYVAYSYKQA